MKNFALFFIITCLGAFTAWWGMPWWIIVISAAAAAALFPQANPVKAYAAGFAAGSLLWAVAAGMLDAANAGLLSERIAGLFGPLKTWHLIGISSLLGGISAGFGALTGHYFREALQKPQKRRYRGKKYY